MIAVTTRRGDRAAVLARFVNALREVLDKDPLYGPLSQPDEVRFYREPHSFRPGSSVGHGERAAGR